MEIAWYVEQCLSCRKLKVEHQRPQDKMQLLAIPMWKWEDITMDFIKKLPRTTHVVDSIWVIIDELTKSAHFIPIQERSSAEKLAGIYIKEVVAWYGVLILVISNRNVRFTSSFRRKFQVLMVRVSGLF